MRAWQGLLIAKEQRHPRLWERQRIHALRIATHQNFLDIVLSSVMTYFLCVKGSVGWRSLLIGNNGSEKSPRIGVDKGHQTQLNAVT